MNRSERKKIGEEVQRINRRMEERHFPRILKAVTWKVDYVKDIIRQDGLNAGVSFLTMDIGNERLSDAVWELYRSVGLRHASRTWSGLLKQQREGGKSLLAGRQTKGFGFAESWVLFIKDYLTRFLIEKITYQVASTTRNKLLQVLTDGIRDGLGADEMVRLLEGPEFARFLRFQTARIVRTEVKRAGETGAKAASATFPYEQNKVWVTIRDSRTRGVDPEDHADHWHMDGQTVDDREKFIDSRSGVMLEFPGDPEAAPKDTINCRCTHAYIAKRDEKGRLLPRKTNVFVERNFNRRISVVTI